MTAEAVHTDAMKIENKNKAGLNSVSRNSFSSSGQKSLCFALFFSASHFTKLILCVLIWSQQQCSVLNSLHIHNVIFVLFFFSANALCQIITLWRTHFPLKHQMAPAQASPFVYISTNQFKAQPLPVHLTGEQTLVVISHYDSAGVNFIHLAKIIRQHYNAQEMFRDLESMHTDFCQREGNGNSMCIRLKDTGTVFINQVI